MLTIKYKDVKIEHVADTRNRNKKRAKQVGEKWLKMSEKMARKNQKKMLTFVE